MNIRNGFSKLLVLAGLMALVAVFGVRSQRAQAYEDPNEKPSPMVGLAHGQTARLNVVNVGNPNISPCEVGLTFFDSRGALLVRDAQTLRPGAAAFLNLNREAVGDPDIRVQIRAVVQSSSTDCLAQVRASLEVYDNDTGKTTLIVAHAFDPQPDPPGKQL
jgi:hypothetical protein